MPRNPAIKTVLVIGAGPIVIGQACEFDYAGTQACTALREEGCKVVLLNSNPATIMTDSRTADVIYIEPISVETVEKIFKKERPDALLPSMGGQVALNLTNQLLKKNLLEQYSVQLLGLNPKTIEKAEDRDVFKKEMSRIGVKVPRSFSISCWEEALLKEKDLKYPIVVRPSFTLGGQGGGIARNLKSLEQICKTAFRFSSKILLEQSIIGWKEYELEVMRDLSGNSIVICGIENIDPMGVHTGDSITVCPIQTLSDKEYQEMRRQAFIILETIEMTSGGCNVQFSINPKTGDMLCIEVNPRVSRSSALASKATGFPIAKIATKLALGYTLNELQNKLTSCSFPSSFEPVVDYVVIKIPRFDFDKFPDANQELSTHMKSVGEIIAIGRTFKESLNKALSSIGSEIVIQNGSTQIFARNAQNGLLKPSPNTLKHIYEALFHEISLKTIRQLTSYDTWFLEQISDLVMKEKIIAKGSLKTLNFEELFRWKQMGFSDRKLASIFKSKEHQIREKRIELGIHPVYKRIDSCSGEFPNDTAYMYSTYEEECESEPTSSKKVLVLGSGSNQIGQGIEYDYCCVHAIAAIRDMGYESIMINCNPETVSTDYDITDRLYLEPLTIEHIISVIRLENPVGTLIQFGGQTSLKLGKDLSEYGLPILGTPFSSIDISENRKKMKDFAENLGIRQPENRSFSSVKEALTHAKTISFPMVLRPSYVIGGKAIQIIWDLPELMHYLKTNPLKPISPILMEKYLDGAMEVEVDAISDGKEVFICGIIEHIEPAGVHSGDSMSYLFPYRLSKKHQKNLIQKTRKLGLSLGVIGLFNLQFALYEDELLLIEANLRASRTVPLLSKTTKLPLAQIATKCILGLSLAKQGLKISAESILLGLKLPVFPFSRLNVNEGLGPQMLSTGEVLCVGKTLDQLHEKAQAYIRDVQDIHPSSNKTLEISRKFSRENSLKTYSSG